MTIKDLIMPTNYFDKDETVMYINSVMFGLSGIILIISILHEYLNDRDIISPLKRFLVVTILLVVAPVVQNFTINKSFEIADGLMNVISDPEKLELVSNPSELLDRLNEKQYLENTEYVTDEEEIDGETFQVKQTETSTMGIIFSQFKNIPNILVATGAFSFITFCFFQLQISYYILYFTTGALFAVPAILSIFPAFESSLAGAFKSFATLFVLPIIVALLAGLLSIKMAEFADGGVTVGNSIHSVTIICALCFAMSSSILIAYGLVSSSGIAQNLGATGALSTAAVMSSTVKLGGGLLKNRAGIANGVRSLKNRFANGGSGGINGLRNTASMATNAIRKSSNKMGTKDGVQGIVGRGVSKAFAYGDSLRNKISNTTTKAKHAVAHHKSLSSPAGRSMGTLKSLSKSPSEFKANQSNIDAFKKSAIKKVRSTGIKMPQGVSIKTPSVSDRKTSTNGHLLRYNGGNSKQTYPISHSGMSKSPSVGKRIGKTTSQGKISNSESKFVQKKNHAQRERFNFSNNKKASQFKDMR